LREIVKDTSNRRGDGKIWKREELRKGVTPRNNFCIVVKPDEEVERGVEVEKETEITGEQVVQEGNTDTGGTRGSGGKKQQNKKGGNPKTKQEDVVKSQQNGRGASKKRKAVDDDDGNVDEEEKPVGEGEEQAKKKSKKSKPVKGKKIVFGDDE
jgi:hypothetical protein